MIWGFLSQGGGVGGGVNACFLSPAKDKAWLTSTRRTVGHAALVYCGQTQLQLGTQQLCQQLLTCSYRDFGSQWKFLANTRSRKLLHKSKICRIIGPNCFLSSLRNKDRREGRTVTLNGHLQNRSGFNSSQHGIHRIPYILILQDIRVWPDTRIRRPAPLFISNKIF